MGYIRHNAIVVTSWEEETLYRAVAKAKELGLTLAGPGAQVVNGYRSFLVCPDGSKEGWADSDAGDEARDAFVEWMNSTRYDDGSGSLHWVEIEYGGDDPERAEIIRHYGAEEPEAARPPEGKEPTT